MKKPFALHDLYESISTVILYSSGAREPCHVYERRLVFCHLQTAEAEGQMSAVSGETQVLSNLSKRHVQSQTKSRGHVITLTTPPPPHPHRDQTDDHYSSQCPPELKYFISIYRVALRVVNVNQTRLGARYVCKYAEPASSGSCISYKLRYIVTCTRIRALITLYSENFLYL